MPPTRSRPPLVAALLAGPLAAACAATPAPHAPAPAASALASPVVASLPFRLVDNRIWVDAFVDHQGPFVFAFDTGGANMVTPALAERLGLASVAAGSTTGAGEGQVAYATARVAHFQLGALELAQQDFMVLDVSPIQAAFALPAFDGLFGFEVLSRYAARIDFAGLRLDLLDGVAPADVAGFDRVPFTLVADKPVIAATIDGVPARVLIDTGDRSSLTIMTAFLAHPEIAAAFPDATAQVTGVGIGGAIPARLGAVGHLAWSPRAALDHVVARQPTTKGGFNALPDLDASIGNEVLRQFTVVFDYAARVAWFAPNAHFGEPTRFTPVPHPPAAQARSDAP
ncbi:MAG: aspartyl protease family protein [Myxococcota bacterium]